MKLKDTIVAISTPLGTGGIGIIRISGEKAFEISKKIFYGNKSFDKIKSHTINWGKIKNPQNNNIIDEVLITKMMGPKTFTKEDVVEINCHSGLIVIKEILKLIINQGARLAKPGEFTKKAFLNGRIDLSQAEAVIDIINSKSTESKKAALDQLDGKLSKEIKRIRDKIIDLLAQIELKIDYPEYDIEDITRENLEKIIFLILEELKILSKSYDRGRLIKEGIKVAIAGRPNVGKSSLLNDFTGKNRAIVTDIPGTTRDTIEEYINIRGIPIKIIDTAGLRETNDHVEKIGIENSKKTVSDADVLIYMISAISEDTNYDKKILSEFKLQNIILIVNKIDLGVKETLISDISDYKFIKVSIKEKIGIEEIENAIEEIFNKGSVDLNSEILITNLRHKKLLDDAISLLNNVLKDNSDKVPVDLISIDITDAADYLGQIIGESVKEDVIDKIFKNFCIGK
ncbi:MAG: tRNA uridine-5-carboxymethylaminomethyl(34) synthesis GTPase MnmE [Clostridiales bacterium]